MKRISFNILSFSVIFLCIALHIACKKTVEPPQVTTEEDIHHKGDLADLAYNPMRPDGTIDSSYLPILTWDVDNYDFGTITEGEVIEKKYFFKNTGTAPLVILNATSTCGCTVPEWPKHRIPPDSTGFILVRFKSKSKEGSQNKDVTIFANTIPNHSKINIRGTVQKLNYK